MVENLKIPGIQPIYGDKLLEMTDYDHLFGGISSGTHHDSYSDEQSPC